MKKTWSILCLAALMALPLAGCAGKRTGSDMGLASASPSAIHSNMPTGNEDLAGSDGIVGDNGVGNTGNDNAISRAGNSALERIGDGVQNTLDDMGDAARHMGQDAKNALDR